MAEILNIGKPTSMADAINKTYMDNVNSAKAYELERDRSNFFKVLYTVGGTITLYHLLYLIFTALT